MILALAVLEQFHQKPEVDNDVISSVAVDNAGMDVPIKLGDSRSNGFRDIRGADFVWNERTNIGKTYPKSEKRQKHPWTKGANINQDI